MNALLTWFLQARLVLGRTGLFNAIAAIIWLSAATAWFVGLPQLTSRLRHEQHAIDEARHALLAVDRPAPAASRSEAQGRLEHFYDALGEARYVEQQIKTLFALAAKNTLSLSQADYKPAIDKNGRFQTYQVTLPVKGSYGVIRQFCEQTLIAIPFASLDEVHFKRDVIANQSVEASLRLTLYLDDASAGNGAESPGMWERGP